MPPRMFPIAIPSWCERAALAVIAISGRLVAIASRISPPSASPSPSRVDSTSVVFERWIPATHTAPAAAAKIATSSGRDSPLTRVGAYPAAPEPTARYGSAFVR